MISSNENIMSKLVVLLRHITKIVLAILVLVCLSPFCVILLLACLIASPIFLGIFLSHWADGHTFKESWLKTIE